MLATAYLLACILFFFLLIIKRRNAIEEKRIHTHSKRESNERRKSSNYNSTKWNLAKKFLLSRFPRPLISQSFMSTTYLEVANGNDHLSSLLITLHGIRYWCLHQQSTNTSASINTPPPSSTQNLNLLKYLHSYSIPFACDFYQKKIRC